MFGQVMPRMRFQLLQRFLHFQDNQDPTYDPNDPDRDRLFKVRTIINKLKRKLQHCLLSSWECNYWWEFSVIQRKITIQAVHQDKKIQIWHQDVWTCYNWRYLTWFYDISGKHWTNTCTTSRGKLAANRTNSTYHDGSLPW